MCIRSAAVLLLNGVCLLGVGEMGREDTSLVSSEMSRIRASYLSYHVSMSGIWLTTGTVDD